MRTIVASLLLSSAAWAQGYSTGFDSGSTGWVFDTPVGGVGWAVDGTPSAFPSGVARTGSSLNYNNGTDYAGCNGGGALSPSIALGGLVNPVLTFWCNYDTETRGTAVDRRLIQVWSADLATMHAEWQLASVGYSFNPAGGIAGVGPGPCGEAYVDLETGTPVTAWHAHRIYLDAAWGDVRIRFVFWTVDDLRNGYGGWAVDDLAVASHPTAAPTGWPDNSPDTITTATTPNDGDGYELNDCRRYAGASAWLRWAWGCTNWGDTGVHMIIGNHNQSILHESFMYYDPGHGHYHMSQYSDFSLWQVQAYGYEKIRRGPKRSFCLTDIDQIGTGNPSISPGCSGVFQAISYRWQDVYARGTSGQEINTAGLASGTDYYLVGVIDPLNRLRETSESNQADYIHFTMPTVPSTGSTQVTIIDRTTPYAPTSTALTIASAAVEAHPTLGTAMVHVIGTGFDVTLVPVLYDGADTSVAEAPFFIITGGTEIWITIPAGIATPASIDLLRARGDAASFRIGGAAPGGCAAPGAPTLTPGVPPPPPPPQGGGGGGGGGHCGLTGLEPLLFLAALLGLRRRGVQ